MGYESFKTKSYNIEIVTYSAQFFSSAVVPILQIECNLQHIVRKTPKKTDQN